MHPTRAMAVFAIRANVPHAERLTECLSWSVFKPGGVASSRSLILGRRMAACGNPVRIAAALSTWKYDT
jgi:hypothetical protein